MVNPHIIAGGSAPLALRVDIGVVFRGASEKMLLGEFGGLVEQVEVAYRASGIVRYHQRHPTV